MCTVGVAAGKGDGVALAADFFLLRAKRKREEGEREGGGALGEQSLGKRLDCS